MKKYHKKPNNNMNRSGIVLLVTLVVLVVLSMLGYTLSSRVMAERLRSQYLIDYSKARYGCDSAMKYALAAMEDIEPTLISRPNEPDFSDLFAMDSEQYKKLIVQWKNNSRADDSEKRFISNYNIDDSNTMDTGTEDGGDVSISGPYGAPWPMITEPAELEIGTAKVRIEIEDENAKYPLGWAMVEDNQIQREIDAGFEIFCEMSGLEYEQIEALKSNLNEIRKIRSFKINFEPVITTTRQPVKTTTASKSSSKTTTTATPVRRTVLTVATQVSNQTLSFAKIFNSSLLDKEMLAKPTIIDDNRKESPLKYISTWGPGTVNINTAPRHVLETAFIFGGNQVEIAEQVIQLRKIEPFKDIEDLQKKVLGYSDSIEKCKIYLTTASKIYTIKITATCGMAKASAVIAVTKDGNTVRQIAAFNS
ncbi:MAG: general secretion pathway protein GspK [Sedimentisphaerales bacterium]|nr:general secretion pathway protein GspK [Sedimentisphaerales bacterium]